MDDSRSCCDASELFGDSLGGEADATALTQYAGGLGGELLTADLTGSATPMPTRAVNPSTPKFRILDTIDTASPVDSVFSYGGGPSPLTPVQPTFSHQKFIRYPLDAALSSLVLNEAAFTVTLGAHLGTGGSAYVYECTLAVRGDHSAPTTLAIKIPIGKSRCRGIVREAEFALRLRRHLEGAGAGVDASANAFIEILGITFLNKDTFPLFRRQDELPCLLMRKMEMDLGSYIVERRQRQTGAPGPGELAIPRAQWWDLQRTLLRALTILQGMGVAHCDIKTENVMVDFASDDITPRFKVIDFSSATPFQSSGELPDLTYLFSAPELLRYDTAARPSSATDLFSTGLVLLHAATGALPYSTAAHDQFYQLMAAQGGKPLDWISPEDRLVLQENPAEARILQAILVDRVALADLVEAPCSSAAATGTGAGGGASGSAAAAQRTSTCSA